MKDNLNEGEKESDIDTVGKCANCGVEFHIHKPRPKKKKKWIYKNHPDHKDTFKYVDWDEPDGYIINGLFYTEKDAVGNKVTREIFTPIPVYFKPQK